MQAIIEVIVPVFGIVALGFALSRAGLFTAATSDGLAGFVYYVAIPALLFRSLATTTLPDALPFAYVAAFYAPTFMIFGLGVALARWYFAWDRPSHGLCGLSSCYSNMVMLGMPLTVTAYGEAAALPLFILMALQSTLIFPLATYVIEIYGTRHSGNPQRLLRSLAKLFLNPVILSLALGVSANLAGVRLAGPLDTVLREFAQAAPACALVSLGISLAQYRLAGELREATAMVALKNLAHPLGVFAACWALAIPADWARVAVLLSAMPSGINGYIFAKRYGLREAAVSKTIVLSTLLTAATSAAVLHYYTPDK